MPYPCYRCDARDSVSEAGGTCSRCLPHPRLTQLVETQATPSSAATSTTKPPSQLMLSRPYVVTWASGGCMVCGLSTRGNREYSCSLECGASVEPSEWVRWVKLCDSYAGATGVTP